MDEKELQAYLNDWHKNYVTNMKWNIEQRIEQTNRAKYTYLLSIYSLLGLKETFKIKYPTSM